MNPEEIQSWALASSAAFSALKEAIEHLPTGEKRKKAEEAFEQAQKKMKVAEASAAKELGFELCMRCWPPEIMILGEDGILLCRNCGQSNDVRSGNKLNISTHGTQQRR